MLRPWLFALFAFPAAASAQAESSSPEGPGPPLTVASAAPSTAWSEQPPPEDDSDWLQLKSGEWLRGRVLGMRKNKIAFDSDKLDDQSIKLKNVARLYLRKPIVVLRSDSSTVRGTGVLVGDTLTLLTDSGPQTTSRDDLLTIVPQAASELQAWHLDAALGLNAARGNVQQAVFNASTNVVREDERTRLVSDYVANYGQSRGKMISHNHRASTRLDVYLSEMLFVTPALAVMEFDAFKNLRTRASLIAGGGMRLLDGPGLHWDVGLGAGYQFVRYESVVAGVEATRKNAAVFAGTSFDSDLTDDIDALAEYVLIVVATDLGLTTHRATGKLEMDLTDLLDLELRVVYERTERPVADDQGEIPKRSDLSCVVALGIDVN